MSENIDLSSLQITEPIFKNVKFYVSGELPNEFVDLLKSGGAERMNYFTDYVTHLICGVEPEETDLQDANEVYEIPAVTPKWIYICVKLKKLVNPKLFTYNPNNLFSNLVFCVSKLGSDLKVIWSLVTYFGGRVKLNLDKSCTHLVTVEVDTEKYKKAIALGVDKIKIVTPDFVVKSVLNKSLVQSELYHPKLIKWPKLESTTAAITGFEPEQSVIDEKILESSAPESTQALLDKLKQRMPWMQPQTSSAGVPVTEPPPPNVVAPSFTGKMPQLDQMRLQQQLLQQQQQQQLNLQQQQQQNFLNQQPTSQQSNVVISGHHLPRSVVHHTPQPQQQQQQQQQMQHNFQQLNMTQQAQISRLLGQQRNPNIQEQLSKLSQLSQQQPQQFTQQQLLQRQQQQISQQPQNQLLQSPTQQQQQRPAMAKPMALQQQQQVLQHMQQMGNRVGLQQQQQLLLNQQKQQQLQQQQQLLRNQQMLQQQQQQQQQFGLQQQQQQVLDQQQQQKQIPFQQQQQQMVVQQQQQQQQFITQNQQQFINQNVQQPQQPQQHFIQQQQQQQQQQQPFNQTQQQMVQPQFPQQQQQQNQQPQQILSHQQQMLMTQQQFPQQMAQQAQPQRAVQQHIWQQQQQQPQQQQPRHPAGIVQQVQGPRVQWSPTQQQQQPQQPQPMPQRQFIQLDAQTHQQLQQMAPDQRAIFVAKLQQKQRQLFMQRQVQMQQQRGHILIRGSVPPGLNPQQQVQWLQQQAKQQGVVLQSNVQAANLQPPPAAATPTLSHGAPGLSPIHQGNLRLQQLQLQREQAQKGAMVPQPPVPASPVPVQPPGQPPTIPGQVVRPIGQPQTVEVPTPGLVDQTGQQHPLVVNAKTKTALANMLSIRLQSGGTSVGGPEAAIVEPQSAAGTLRLMTQQHNAALNSSARPQDILALQQQRRLNVPAPDLVRPAVPMNQGEPPKLQYSPRAVVPLQHRPGTFYGHNPNLKLPPDLFLLGCIFVVVELERYLEESIPDWKQKIEKHGGEVEQQYCSRVTHVLCETQRHGVVMQALRDCKRCVTLYWLSDVMKRKQVLPPWTALHLPTMYLDTTPASKHLVALSGFVGQERNRVKHMIKYTGASCTTYFSKHNTLLIAAKCDGPKYVHAKKWGIPVVNIQWLTDVMLGNFSALNQMEHVKYQQFMNPPNFSFDPTMVPNLMFAWKMPINISQESYERVKRSASPTTLQPKKQKKLKIEATNDDQEDDMHAIMISHYRILFSNCNDIENLKKIVRRLGGVIALDHREATHLVMNQLQRTNKLLFCVSRGLPVLPESWLRDSAAADKFLDETSYSLDAKEFNSVYRCDFAQTLATRNRNRLLEGKFFYITPSVYPNKKVLTELIQSCGGIVEKVRRSSAQIEATNINSPYSYVILTHENDLHLVADLLKNKKDKIRVVCNVELVLSAILRQTFEVEPYAVKIL